MAARLTEVRDLSLSLDEAANPEPALQQLLAKRLAVGIQDVGAVLIVRRALDSRRHRPQLVYAVHVALPEAVARPLVESGRAAWAESPQRARWHLPKRPDGPPPLVVGAGPAGLFAALTLAEAGWQPILIERGKVVEERSHDVSRLYRTGELDGDSNVCYGEGGAGTYSDGKLYTRVGDERVRVFMEKLVALGADPDILINARPHLGTDRLIDLMQAIRTRLLELGATLRYGHRLDDLDIADGALRAVRLASGEELPATRLVLASGHSARAVWEMLQRRGFRLEARPFAVGFRVEHPQALIDEIQYGRFAGHASLPAADYRLAHNDAGRGVYSFCMCPGGVVVTTPTDADELCINGMSHAARSGRYANSALVVSVNLQDFAASGDDDVFCGVRFQQAAERAAYAAGGGAFVAPAQRLSDFATGKASSAVGATSYRRGLLAGSLDGLYPAAVTSALRQALKTFGQRMRGFVSSEAKLIGVETRTASPVRVQRGEDGVAVGIAGVYPAGEGMGYGGGIASAAVDGMRAAEAMLEQAGAVQQAL